MDRNTFDKRSLAQLTMNEFSDRGSGGIELFPNALPKASIAGITLFLCTACVWINPFSTYFLWLVFLCQD